MILVDTSVWVEFFRGSREAQHLSSLLAEAKVSMHPYVFGELALGHLGSKRKEILQHFKLLPSAPLASDDEVLKLVEEKKLYGRGVGWVDMHILVSSLLGSMQVWTNDRRLQTCLGRSAYSPELSSIEHALEASCKAE